MPDEELMKDAKNGSLLKKDVLKKHVNRMLNHKRRLALSENFASQWKDGLESAIAPLLCTTARRITLHNEDF